MIDFNPSDASKAWTEAGYDDPERAAERFRGGLRQAFINGYHNGAARVLLIKSVEYTDGDEYATSKVGELGERRGMDNTYEHRALSDAFNAGVQSERNRSAQALERGFQMQLDALREQRDNATGHQDANP